MIVMKNTVVRRALLVLAAFVFFAIALGSLLTPHTMAAQLGYVLDNADALNEFRAVYVGLWISTGVLLLIAARRMDLPLIGDLGALLILGQTFGRIVSVALDGMPSAKVWPIFALELIGGIAILLVRPNPSTCGRIE